MPKRQQLLQYYFDFWLAKLINRWTNNTAFPSPWYSTTFDSRSVICAHSEFWHLAFYVLYENNDPLQFREMITFILARFSCKNTSSVFYP